MRKLIIHFQEFEIECDNKKCDYKVLNENGDPNVDIQKHLNVPCPKCGGVLLTETDYKAYIKLNKEVNWVNKWFSWVTIFVPKKVERLSVDVHVHDGLNIKK